MWPDAAAWRSFDLRMGMIADLFRQVSAQLRGHVLAGLQHFGMHDGERRNFCVPFQQRRHAASFLMSQAVQFPDRIGDVIVVRIEQVGAARRVAGQVHLHDAMVRQVGNVFDRDRNRDSRWRHRRC